MATYYWVSGGNGLWSSSTNWSLSSGGTGGAGVPGTSDKAIFDANSPNVTLDTSPTLASIDGWTYPANRVFAFASYNITLTGYGAVARMPYNVYVTANVSSPVITLSNSTSNALSIQWYATIWYSDPISMQFLISDGVSFVIPSGNYNITLEGNVGAVDFSTGTFSGTVGISSQLAVYSGFKCNSSLSIGGYVGADLYVCGTDVPILSNGKYFDFKVVILNYFHNNPGLVLLDALSAIGIIVYDNGSFNMNGKNATSSNANVAIDFTGSMSFGSGNPTLTFANSFYIYSGSTFSGQGTATLSSTNTNATLKCFTASLTVPATINKASSTGQLTVNGGAYLNIRNTGYGTVKFTGPVRFVDFSLNGTSLNPLTVQGTASSTAISKVDPWYVGPNSTDAGGNTGILFSGNEGSDYLTVSNLSGTYNYGPHFMAFM